MTVPQSPRCSLTRSLLVNREVPMLVAKTYVIYLLLPVFLLAACGQASPGTSTSPAATTTPAATASASSTPAEATLLQTCQQVESVIINLNGVPTAERYGAARTQVQVLSDAADLETQNALN